VQAAGQVKSGEVAAKVLRTVGEIAISGQHVNRLTAEIGTELKEIRDRETEDYVLTGESSPANPLPKWWRSGWTAVA
jgi:hypothetical protein